MAILSFDDRGFLLRSQRITVIGARCEYSLLDRSSWRTCLLNLRQSGFNTVLVSAPWSAHEVREGQYDFSDNRDLPQFLEECANLDLHVILRVGPNVGRPFSCGALPDWLPPQSEGSNHREANPAFLAPLTNWWKQLFAEIRGFQHTDDQAGPLLAIQIEHEWNCGHQDAGLVYFKELQRLVTELGIDAPVITSNDFWQDIDGTIDVWSEDVSSDSLFANTRQLSQVQSDAPRLILIKGGAKSPHLLAGALKSVIAAGGMPVVDDAVGGIHRMTMASLGDDIHLVPGALLDHHGSVVSASRDAILVVRFAGTFASLLSQLDPKLDTPVSRPDPDRMTVVPRQGSAGSVLHFIGPDVEDEPIHDIVLADGRMMRIQPCRHGSWPLINVDLNGKGRLDYTDASIMEIVQRKLVLAFGSPGSTVRFGINGRELECVVPADGALEPTLLEINDLHLVICNPDQARSIAVDEDGIIIGVRGFHSTGLPIRDSEFKTAYRVDLEGVVSVAETIEPSRTTRSRRKIQWMQSPQITNADGSNQRFARLQTPRSLASCGGNRGIGWYRVNLENSAPGDGVLHFPPGPYRFNLFRSGTRILEGGLGTPGAFDVDIPLVSDSTELSVLVEHLGGSCSGNHQVENVGLFDPIEFITPLKDVTCETKRNQPPFDTQSMRGYIPESQSGQESSTTALNWNFTHLRKKSLRVQPGTLASGCWLLNDEPLIRSEIATATSFKLVPGETVGLKRGKNILSFRPDVISEALSAQLGRSLIINEIISEVGADSGSISFASTRIPDGLTDRYTAVEEDTEPREPTGIPTWYRATIEPSARPVALELRGMSRGMVFINDEPAGLYDSSTSQTVSIPRRALEQKARIDLLDVMGCDPRSIALGIANH